MITVSRALALPEWSQATVLAGAGSTVSAGIEKVAVIATARHPMPESAQGALVVVIGPIDRDDWHLDTLIRRVASAGGSALLIEGSEALRRPASLVAGRLGVPVVGVPDALSAAVALRTHLALSELAAARLLLTVSTACRDAPPGVDQLVHGAGEAAGRTIWLLDSAGHVVSGPPGPDDLAEVLTRPTRLDDAFVHLPVISDDPRGAHLVIARRPTDELSTLEPAAQIVAEAVAGRLATQRLDAERDARHRMSLLSELVGAGGQLAPGTPMRMLEQSWKVDGWHLGIRIDVPTALDPVALRPDVVQAFSDAGLSAVVVEQGSGWAAWSTFSQAPTAAEQHVRSTAIRRVQWRLRTRLLSVMGVGSLQAGPVGLVRSLGEAADAARIAVSRAAGGHVVQFDRLGLSRLLVAWTQTDVFAPAAASLLTPLHDQPGELLETLSAYLDAESSVSETAAVLGVHRNTVAARVTRAAELLSVDLTDPDERMALQLACRSFLSQR